MPFITFIYLYRDSFRINSYFHFVPFFLVQTLPSLSHFYYYLSSLHLWSATKTILTFFWLWLPLNWIQKKQKQKGICSWKMLNFKATKSRIRKNLMNLIFCLILIHEENFPLPLPTDKYASRWFQTTCDLLEGGNFPFGQLLSLDSWTSPLM